MRPPRMLSGLVMLLAASGSAYSQSAPYSARVIVAEAEVRSGPSTSPEVYATNKLHMNDMVEVVQEKDGGWLAIKPPAKSYSWINGRFVEKVGNQNKYQWVVENPAGAPVLIGSSLKPDKPTVEGPKLERGTQVTAIGDMLTDQSGRWLPIVPPPTELRYVRAADVAKSTGTVQTTSSSLGSAGGGSTQPVAKPAPAGAHPLFLQAQQAEQAGRINEAIDLYHKCGRQVNGINDELAHQCFNKAHWLQGGHQRGQVSASGRISQPYRSDQSMTYCVPAPVCPPTQGAYRQSQYGGAGSEPPRPLQTTQRGWLRTTRRTDLPTGSYALVTSKGDVVTYVSAPANLDLIRFVGRSVEVSGQMVYDMGLRSNYMAADRVTPVQ